MLVYAYNKYGLMCMNLTFDMFKLIGELSLIDDKEKLNNEFRHVIRLSKNIYKKCKCIYTLLKS